MIDFRRVLVRGSLTTLIVLAALAGPMAGVGHAQESMPVAMTSAAEEDDPFAGFFYEPELVFAHADEIGLTEAQRTKLIDLVVSVQSDVTRIKLQAAGSVGPLQKLLGAEVIDGDAVLPLVNTLLEVENETKRRYLTMLIELHNDLTPRQRSQLDELRKG